MADDGFHEIQLSGKQLIFLFMTTAVVLVVTFLCGVLVGRGVRTQKDQAVAAEALTQATPGAVDPTASAAALQPAPKAAPQTPPASPPPQPEEDLSYYSRLEGQSAPAEATKPTNGPRGREVSEKPAAKAAKAADPKAANVKAKAAPAPPTAEPAAAASSDPAGAGFALRLAAYRDKATADALASRLAGKGYSTFVVPMSSKGSTLYSVRVGRFKTRKEADTARRRLEKEEKFKPLLTPAR
ncbi:MAG TPA: SPOR domain-containing protein [Vicinamibacterales bacterium]